MVRCGLTLLVVLVALVPPGVCQCRLAIFLGADVAAHDPAEDPCPTHPEEEDDHDADCGCRPLKPDCVISSTHCLTQPNLDQGLAWRPPTKIDANGSLLFFLQGNDSFPASAQPLYVTLRALRI